MYLVPTTGLHTRPAFCKQDHPPALSVLTLSVMTVFKVGRVNHTVIGHLIVIGQWGYIIL
jgi:hypothetical protein